MYSTYVLDVLVESLLPLLLLLLGDTVPLGGRGEEVEGGGTGEGGRGEGGRGRGGEGGGATRYMLDGVASCLNFRSNRLPGGEDR